MTSTTNPQRARFPGREEDDPTATHQKLVRRSKMQICCEILRVMGIGATKQTHIMYKANLCWSDLHTCMDLLLAQGLVTRDLNVSTKVEYHMTSKGFSLLKRYLEISYSISLLGQ